MNNNNTTIIIGAGPAGLAAGFELSQKAQNPQGSSPRVICLEKDAIVGGISRTVCHNGFRFDIGGHRFFTKIDRVNDLWRKVLGDDFMKRNRLSRIYYNGKFFQYPLKPTNALAGLGLINSCAILFSYFATKVRPYPREDTFEQWVSNRFGRKLYKIFFKTYTEKVWGIPCDQIQAEWAAQRIKGLSLASAIKTALLGNKGNIKTLIEQFDYPKLGPGQMYEKMAEIINQPPSPNCDKINQCLLNHKVTRINVSDNKFDSVCVEDADGNKKTITGNNFLSSMPIDELVRSMNPSPPQQVLTAAANLKYRSLLTVNLMMKRKETFPDTWIYIHAPEVKVGRVQCFSNWSPFMVPSPEFSSLGLEYFCSTGDELWNSPDEQLVDLAKKEISQLGLADPATVIDAFVIRTPKTYPVYSMDYRENLEVIKNYLADFTNLQCIGRNGMFKYNNMDHSILSGLLAADNILGAHHNLWEINTEEEYHEQK